VPTFASGKDKMDQRGVEIMMAFLIDREKQIVLILVSIQHRIFLVVRGGC